LGGLTTPVWAVERPCAKASQPTIVEISWTRVFVSLAFVDEDRSWLSFARRHGWEETWTFGGREEAIVVSETDISWKERV
jgi:hypothetical protein